jgi:hypothetical protein
MTFTESVRNALTYIRENPNEMVLTPKDMMAKLYATVKSSGQGSANQTNPHEGCIATVLEANGFVLAPRNVIPQKSGIYYWYQPNGTQRKGDFVMFWAIDGVKKLEVIIDAKHGASETIFLNDGWFDEDTVYIISFTSPVKRGTARANVCFVGMGRDIPTEEDAKIRTHIIGIKNELNKSKKTMMTSFLKICFRFANQYSCKQFTPDFNEDRFQKMLAWLAPSGSQTLPEPHSPPA